MEQVTEDIQALFSDHDIEMYAMGDASLMDHVRPGNQPRDFLPDANSMICIAIPFPKGIYTSPKNMETAYWWHSNSIFGWTENLMIRACRILEEQGHAAYPIPGCFPLDIDLKGEFIGYISLIHMAEALKIGKVGKNGLIFHSKYGPRLILGGLVTTARLPAMTVPEADQAECPKGCSACQEQCPAGAIDAKGRVDIVKCVLHAGESPGRFVYVALFRMILPILSALKLVNTQGMLPTKWQRLANITFANTHGMFTCIHCVSGCPYLDGG